MTAPEFVDKWKRKKVVGIEVYWEEIRSESKVYQFFGKEAWEKIYDFTPPWYKPEERRPFRDLITGGGENYTNEIKMEKEKTEFNKFEFIKRDGLVDPLSPIFVAFAEPSGVRGVLGDGCHRFLVADYLIRSEGLDLTRDVQKAELDVICLENFGEVIPFDLFG